MLMRARSLLHVQSDNSSIFIYVEFTHSTVFVICGVYESTFYVICGVYLVHYLCYMWSLLSPLSFVGDRSPKLSTVKRTCPASMGAQQKHIIQPLSTPSPLPKSIFTFPSLHQQRTNFHFSCLSSSLHMATVLCISPHPT